MNTCPLNNPSKQEVFDFGLKKIIEQGKPSVNPQTRGCQYRSEDGTRCIVGHMLGDDVDLTNLNGGQIGFILKGITPTAYDWMKEPSMLRFLNSMQGCHDDAYEMSYEGEGEFLEIFKTMMQDLARSHQLEYKEPA